MKACRLLALALTVASIGGVALPDEPPSETAAINGNIEGQRPNPLRAHLEALEKRLQKMEQNLQDHDAGAEAEPAPETQARMLVDKNEASPVVAYWKDAFVLSTIDENFWMKIRGNLHFDCKYFAKNTGNIGGFDVRRARIDFQGAFYRNISFRIQGELADTPHVRNAWVDYRFTDALHLRAGQMKPPFSTAWWTQSNNLQFIEHGAGTPIYPYFDRGLWLWGALGNGKLSWNASVFNGAGSEADEKDGDVDRHKDFYGRLFLSPFLDRTGSPLEGLHLCVQGSLGKQSAPTRRFELKGFGTAIREDRFWTWESEANTTIGRRDRLGLELHYIAGPVTISSEYLSVLYENIRVLADDGQEALRAGGNVTSWSTWAGVYITGERQQVSNFGWRQPRPKRNFIPGKPEGAGAWEILFRYTLNRTSENLFGGHDLGGVSYRVLAGSERVDEYTLGLNWTWNPHVRWLLNYVQVNGDGEGIRTSAAARIDSDRLLTLRMIFKF